GRGYPRQQQGLIANQRRRVVRLYAADGADRPAIAAEQDVRGPVAQTFSEVEHQGGLAGTPRRDIAAADNGHGCSPSRTPDAPCGDDGADGRQRGQRPGEPAVVRPELWRSKHVSLRAEVTAAPPRIARADRHSDEWTRPPARPCAAAPPGRRAWQTRTRQVRRDRL